MHRRTQRQKTEIIRFREKQTENSWIPILWQTLLVMGLTGGYLSEYLQVVKVRSFVVAWVLVNTLLVALWREITQRQESWKKWKTLLPVVLLFLQTGIAFFRGMSAGLQGIINSYIACWNIRQEDGIAGFSIMNITPESIEAVTLLLFLLIGISCSWLVQKKQSFLILTVNTVWVLTAFFLNRFSVMGCAFIMAMFLSVCFLHADTSRYGRSIFWSCFFTVLLLGIAVFCGKSEVSSITRTRKSVGEWVEKLRYGEDSLPEGNLYQAEKMLDGEEERLVVTTMKAKQMYLRGYVGVMYEKGMWQPLKKADYGGENAGMLEWLGQQDFQPEYQYYDYARIYEQEVDRNRVSVKNVGARRNYIYHTYSALPISQAGAFVQQDGGVLSAQLFGAASYEFREDAVSQPSELMSVERAYLSPEREEERRYVQAESVYREFVYRKYLTVPEETEGLIRELFWEEAKEEDTRNLYFVTQRIREVLKEKVFYRSIPEKIPEEEDPVSWFLTEAKEGNSALYASAAVLAFREAGIPARYVEGYYLNNEENRAEKVVLTTQDSHAWAEVYLDGIGWLPVDVTPGYYYDVYELMDMYQSPKQAAQTLSASKTAREILAGDNGQGTAEPGKDEVHKRRILISSLLLLLLCAAAVIVYKKGEKLFWLVRMQLRYSFLPKGQQSRFLCREIIAALKRQGISVELGRAMDETGKLVQEKFPRITAAEYERVYRLLEKYAYGEEVLAPHENSVLLQFMEKIYFKRK